MSDISLHRIGDAGMVQLRGDPARLAAALAADPPERLGASITGDGAALLWFGPDELLWLGARGDVGACLTRVAEGLGGARHLAVDMSDARTMFRLEGPATRLSETLAKLTPADMAPAVFVPGSVRRTRLAQVAAAVWMPQAGRVEVLCFRSVATYVEGLLRVSADPAAPVGHH